jgi:hypothetical protein
LGVDGSSREIMHYETVDGITSIPLDFLPYESYFVVFDRKKSTDKKQTKLEVNFPTFSSLQTLEGAWDVSFDPRFGGPDNIRFEELRDWTKHETRGVKYYSGIATYRKTIHVDMLEDKKYFIDLGVVNDMARVRLNGEDMGVVWCAPWRLDISGVLKEGTNELEIEVANRWINRLLGDMQEPDANMRTVRFDNGLMGGLKYQTGRYTFTTRAALGSFNFKEPLPSGLLGPVVILEMLIK